VANLRAIDAKAGVLLGFDGALIALNRGLPFLWQVPSIALSAASAAFAALALRPRKFDTLNPGFLVTHAAAQAEHTLLNIQNHLVAAIEGIDGAAKPKLKWIKYALWCLAAAALTFSVGVINPHLSNGAPARHGPHQSVPSSHPGSGSSGPVSRSAVPSSTASAPADDA
jgi:hypothetical protein